MSLIQKFFPPIDFLYEASFVKKVHVLKSQGVEAFILFPFRIENSRQLVHLTGYHLSLQLYFRVAS